MKNMKKAFLFLVTTIAILGLFYISWQYFYLEQEKIENKIVDTIKSEKVENPDVEITSIYWGNYETPANESEVCNSEKFIFSVEATTKIKVVNYNECYLKNNNEKIETRTLEKFENYIAMSSEAKPTVENNIQACCDFDGENYCSDILKLYLCKH